MFVFVFGSSFARWCVFFEEWECNFNCMFYQEKDDLHISPHLLNLKACGVIFDAVHLVAVCFLRYVSSKEVNSL